MFFLFQVVFQKYVCPNDTVAFRFFNVYDAVTETWANYRFWTDAGIKL